MHKESNIQLSILIPSIPSRFEMAVKLYRTLLAMVGDKNIEVLMFTDNKQRTIGAKREGLKNLSQGKYFMFCDDDDEFISLDEIYEATFQDVDVIDFKAKCRNSDGSTYIVTQKLGNQVEHNTENGSYLDCDRPPFPNCAWNTAGFKQYSFRDVSYGEDWSFIIQCLKTAKTEIFIDKALFKYNFNPEVSEAPAESN